MKGCATEMGCIFDRFRRGQHAPDILRPQRGRSHFCGGELVRCVALLDSLAFATSRSLPSLSASSSCVDVVPMRREYNG